MYGEIAGVPQVRVVSPQDGEQLAFGDGSLLFIDSTGHAPHHFSVWDAVSRGFFTGDNFGLSYREFDTAAGPFVRSEEYTSELLSIMRISFDVIGLKKQNN